MSRNKELRKSIVSLERQIEIHKAKREEALSRDDFGLAGYFDKEIDHMEKQREARKRKLCG